ncbi:MAG: hypothetical protein COA58_11035 [Bacteroidetes bacterium]|nr:MAG: hypothetical protein COA58_11035 [Bacteroidota bacterium]
MQVPGNNPDEYVQNIPDERKYIFTALRKVINDNMPPELEECMNYGMIGYVIPKSIYPAGYHVNPELPLPFASIASQKNFIAFYHMGLYANREILTWFVEEYKSRCKYKLDMGKSCVRFKKIDDIPIELIGELMTKISTQDWIDMYEEAIKK